MESCLARRAFVVPRGATSRAGVSESGLTRPTSDPVVPDSCVVSCDYTATAINPHPGCMDVQRFHNSGRPQMLAFGGGRSVVLGQEVNGDMRVFKTLAGHKDTVTCVAWIDSFSGPSHTQFKSHLLSASADGEIKLWIVDQCSHHCVASFAAPGSVISLHGCYLSSDETGLLVAAASQDSVIGWRIVGLQPAEETTTTTTTTATQVFVLSRSPDLCLTLHIVPLSSSGLFLLFVGMTTGRLDVWCVRKTDQQTPVMAGSLKGHTDWLVSLDCQKTYPPSNHCGRGSSASTDEHVLVATGSQDNHIRVWHVQLNAGAQQPAGQKGRPLILPDPLAATHRLVAHLECVLAGHDNWVTGLAWHPAGASAPLPRLLSSSRDKSLIIWAPSQPLFGSAEAESSSVSSSSAATEVDMWLERARFGIMGGNLMGFHGCAWGGYNNEVYGHGFNGDLSIWSLDGEARITLTGHFGAVTSLAWCRPTIDSTPLPGLAADEAIYPPYLLTASRDHTVRLHGLFYTSGMGGCQPPVTMWRELARPQVHGYEMNAVGSIDAVRYVSAGDEKVFRVFTATRGFVDRLLDTSVIQDHPDLLKLSTGAVQAALGLSNRAAGDNDDDDGAVEGGANAEEDELRNSGYPPTEAALSELTLWTETNKLYGHGYEVYTLAVHPKEILVASACKASKEEFAKVFLWRTDNWQIHQQISLHQLTVTALRFDASGDRFVSVSRDRTWALSMTSEGGATTGHTELLTYKLHSRSPPGRECHSRIIWACAWTPDNGAFLTASRDKRIMAWSATAGARIGAPQTFTDPITALDVGPHLDDPKPSPFLAAIGYEFGGIELASLSIDATTLVCQSVVRFPADYCHMGLSVRQVSFAPLTLSKADSVALASCGDDGLVRIFRILIDEVKNLSQQ